MQLEMRILCKKRRLLYLGLIIICFFILVCFIIQNTDTLVQNSVSQSCQTEASSTDIQNTIGEIIDFFGSVLGLYDQIPFRKFAYPMNIDFNGLLKRQKQGKSIAKYGVPAYKENIKFLVEPRYKCNSSSRSPLILLFIKSAIRNFANRLAIRKTWANEADFGYIKTVFTVGKIDQNNDKVSGFDYVIKQLEEEIRTYGDILQIDVVDHYHNNTKKLLACLNWTVSSCAVASYVMLVDDDYFVATDRIRQFIQNSELKKQQYVYMGYSISQLRPHRSSFSKWKLSYEEYPYDAFPEFLAAGSLLLSQAFVKDAIFAAPYVKQLFTDDVYLGIIAHKLGVKPNHNRLMSNAKVTKNEEVFKNVLTSHGYRCVHELHAAWTYYTTL